MLSALLLGRLLLSCAGEDLDSVVSRHPAALCLQPPDPLPDLLDALVSPRPAQPFGQSRELLLEALNDTLYG